MSKSLLLAAVLTCAAAAAPSPRPAASLAGDWDVYIALSAQPKFGFEGWRRMGFAHFAGADLELGRSTAPGSRPPGRRRSAPKWRI